MTLLICLLALVVVMALAIAYFPSLNEQLAADFDARYGNMMAIGSGIQASTKHRKRKKQGGKPRNFKGGFTPRKEA